MFVGGRCGGEKSDVGSGVRVDGQTGIDGWEERRRE